VAQSEGLTAGAHRAAVLGHPVGHTLSPVLHRAAYRALGLVDWEYESHDVQEPDLAAFVSALDNSWVGLSLTMPLKLAIIPMLDHIEPLAEVVGAVNTVLVQAGFGSGRPVLVGANTDVHGIVAALQEAVAASGRELPRHPTAAVLGAGATAASSLAALGQLGCTTPVVHLRSMGRSGPLIRAAHRMGVSPRYAPLSDAADSLLRADLVISTLPANAADPIAAQLSDRTDALIATGSRAGALLDVVYHPRPTALSLAWERAGGAVVGGERMLLHQAAEQIRLMTGRPAPLAAMEAALAAELAAG
jgi:shikimate dehydrogenase